MGGSSSAASRIRLASTSRLEKASRLSCTVRRSFSYSTMIMAMPIIICGTAPKKCAALGKARSSSEWNCRPSSSTTHKPSEKLSRR